MGEEEPLHKTAAPGMTRRELLVAGAGIVGLCAIGGATRIASGQDQLLRPPGGQDARAFEGACIRCDRCRSACPQGAIGVAHLEDSLLSVRTPKMVFKYGYCDFCADLGSQRCVDSCPTGAIAPGFDPAADKIGIAVVDADECILYRTGGSNCSKTCIDACSFGALSISDNGSLMVDAALCNGCGACEYACISTTFASYTGSGRKGVNVEYWNGDNDVEV